MSVYIDQHIGAEIFPTFPTSRQASFAGPECLQGTTVSPFAAHLPNLIRCLIKRLGADQPAKKTEDRVTAGEDVSWNSRNRGWKHFVEWKLKRLNAVQTLGGGRWNAICPPT
jgi:hypothetical protein